MLTESYPFYNPTDDHAKGPTQERPGKTPGSVQPGQDSLPATLARYGIALSAEQAALVDQFAQLLWDWNQKVNLTRHTDYEKFVGRDIVDTLAFAEFLQQGENCLLYTSPSPRDS